MYRFQRMQVFCCWIVWASNKRQDIITVQPSVETFIFLKNKENII